MTPSLDRRLILATAREILDTGGRTALSMRVLATRLDVKAASLYHHISGKDELLQEIVDELARDVLRGLDLSGDGRTILARLAERLRETLRLHPGSTEAVATLQVSAAVAEQIGTQFGPPLASALGTTVERALLTAQSLYVLVIGLALAEFGDVPNEPAAPREYYDSWFELATTIFLDGAAAPSAH